MKQPVHRCAWADPADPAYIRYHDEVWGVPVHDDRMLFEMLILEGFQAGLSWATILHKKEHFEAAFDGFDAGKISQYDQARIEQLAADPGIIRNRLKIQAAVTNAGVFLQMQKEFGSFSDWLWSFTEGKVIYEYGPTSSPLSDQISSELKKRGMKFVGTTIIYAYLQAVGVIYGHAPDCDLFDPRENVTEENS